MRLYKQKHCQLDVKEKEMGQNEGRPLDFLGPIGILS